MTANTFFTFKTYQVTSKTKNKLLTNYTMKTADLKMKNKKQKKSFVDYGKKVKNLNRNQK